MKIPQHSQGNTCVGVFFKIKSELTKIEKNIHIFVDIHQNSQTQEKIFIYYKHRISVEVQQK